MQTKTQQNASKRSQGASSKRPATFLQEEDLNVSESLSVLSGRDYDGNCTSQEAQAQLQAWGIYVD